jgi:hypothetical protein
MNRTVLALALLLQETAVVRIVAPIHDEIVRGQVAIVGSTNLPGFASAEFAFSYAQDDTDTWFLIGQSDMAVEMGELAVWDTSSVADGDYTVRVRVYLQDGSFSDAAVSGLRVRNNDTDVAAVATETRMAAPTDSVPAAIETGPPPAAPPAMTPLTERMPTAAVLGNPVVLPETSVINSLKLGALLVLALSGLLGLVVRVRRG